MTTPFFTLTAPNLSPADQAYLDNVARRVDASLQRQFLGPLTDTALRWLKHRGFITMMPQHQAAILLYEAFVDQLPECAPVPCSEPTLTIRPDSIEYACLVHGEADTPALQWSHRFTHETLAYSQVEPRAMSLTLISQLQSDLAAHRAAKQQRKDSGQ